MGPAVGVGLHHVLPYRQGGGEGADLQEVRAVIGQLHHEGPLVRGGDPQGGGGGLPAVDGLIAGDHVDHIAVVGGGGGVGEPPPGVDEIPGGEGGPVGPLQVLPQGEGIGDGAVVVDRLLIALGLARPQLGPVEAPAPLYGLPAVFPAHEALEEVLGQDGPVQGGVLGGVQGGGLGGDAHPQVQGPGGPLPGLPAAARQGPQGQRPGQDPRRESYSVHGFPTS